MLKAKWLHVVLAGMLLVNLTACQMIEDNPKAARGAGIGALSGAVVGGVAKGSKGALVGAFVGALAGGGIGAYLDHKDRSAEETRRAYDYNPSRGVELLLSEVDVDPSTVEPGDSVSLAATYAVMAPRDDTQLTLTETRLISLRGERVASAEKAVVRTPGTYTSELQVKLPDNAARGTYTVVVTVEGAGESTQMTSTFEVD